MKPAEDAPSTAAWAKLLTVQAVLVEAIEAKLKAARLPPLAWYDVLWALERAPGARLRMAELADRLVVSRYNVTRLVDRLQDAGLVEREPAPDDARGAYAALTTAGRSMRRRMWSVYGGAIDELFLRHMSARERDALEAALGKVLAGVRGGAR
jgi:DNA-binding MarR family transcriptional regulator